MDVNKLPRWILIWGFLGFMSLAGLTLRGAFADLDEAKSTSVQNSRDIIDIKQNLLEIQAGQRQFSEKYDRNQEENQRVFRQILQAVK